MKHLQGAVWERSATNAGLGGSWRRAEIRELSDSGWKLLVGSARARQLQAEPEGNEGGSQGGAQGTALQVGE